MKSIVLVSLLGLLPLAAQTNTPSAARDPFSDPLVQQIVARHEKAVNGDKKETKALTADLEKWTQEQPENYLLLAYLGSAYTLCSRDAWPGPGKLTYLRKGGQCLEAAVAGDPNNPAVRFVRAIDYFELPAIFGKHRTANDDFQILVKQLEGELPMPAVLKAETAQAIYYYAGLSDLSYSMLPEAKDVWQRGLHLAPSSKIGVKIQAELAKLK
jgi:cytochrome c-type biogenesis protein CcmH/NrfG